MKIAIFGGTFDPPHLGHISIAKYAYEHLQLDKFLFIPNGTPAYKTNSRRVSDKYDRLNMLKIALKDLNWCDISTIEIDREGNTYTADTLMQLNEGSDAHNEYFLIIGSDSFEYIDKWYKPEIIFDLSTVVVLLRNNSDINELIKLKESFENKFAAKIILLQNDIYEVSSSEIRENILNNLDVSNMISKDVEEYIKEHHLYER